MRARSVGPGTALVQNRRERGCADLGGGIAQWSKDRHRSGDEMDRGDDEKEDSRLILAMLRGMHFRYQILFGETALEVSHHIHDIIHQERIGLVA